MSKNNKNNQFRGRKRRRDRIRRDGVKANLDNAQMKELFESRIIFWGWDDIRKRDTIESVFIQLKFPEPVEPNSFMAEFIERVGDLVI